MLLMLSVFGLVVIADQLAKAMVVARLDEGVFTAGIIGGVRLRHVVNRRRLWGSAGAIRFVAFVWILLCVAASIVAGQTETQLVHAGLGAVVGGATGNLLDGIARKGVVDFIDLRVWPVFNLADAAIVGGVVLLLWTTFGSN
ncbi:MAG: signal peptidase II [Gemmatimonadales bacterium]